MQDSLKEITCKLNNVVIVNGIEETLSDDEYIAYLKNNGKPISWDLLERMNCI